VLQTHRWIYFDARGFITADDFVIVDDLNYNATLCGPQSSSTAKPSQSTSGTSKGGACAVLNCDFSRSSRCGTAVPGGTGNWQLGAGRVGNPNTGIPGDPLNPRDGNFAYVAGPQSKDAVMDLPAVDIAANQELEFQYYKASFGSVLEAYADGQKLWSDDSTTRTSRKWQSQRIKLPQGSGKAVKFVARNVERNEYVGIDELTLLSNGVPVC